MFFAVSPGFSLVLDRKGRLGGTGGKVKSACEEFEDNEDGIGLMFLIVLVMAYTCSP